MAQVEEDVFDKYIPFLMVLAFIAIVLFGEFQYHKDEVYISPNQRDQLNKIIRQSTFLVAAVPDLRQFGGGFGGGGSSGGGFGGGGFGGGGAGGSW